jgi:hypothetical protein
MEGYILIASFLLLIFVVKYKNKLENSPAYKNATDEEQKKMLEKRDLVSKEKMAAATKEYYDYGENKSAIPKSNTSSSNTNITHSNPSTGLPMSNGIGGVDTSGTPYGM